MNLIDGDRIKAKRLRKGYSLEDVEKLSGIKTSNISQIENNGQRGVNPTVSTLTRLATALDLVFMIYGNGEPVKILDAYNNDIPLITTDIEQELKDFIKEPSNIKWLRLAKVIAEDKDGIDAYAVRTIYNSIKKI